jgi:hypothetical protein
VVENVCREHDFLQSRHLNRGIFLGSLGFRYQPFRWNPRPGLRWATQVGRGQNGGMKRQGRTVSMACNGQRMNKQLSKREAERKRGRWALLLSADEPTVRPQTHTGRSTINKLAATVD